MNILELSKQKTMSCARFATLTAEEKVILLESKDSKNIKDATKFAVSTFRQYLTEKGSSIECAV